MCFCSMFKRIFFCVVKRGNDNGDNYDADASGVMVTMTWSN